MNKTDRTILGLVLFLLGAAVVGAGIALALNRYFH